MYEDSEGVAGGWVLLNGYYFRWRRSKLTESKKENGVLRRLANNVETSDTVSFPATALQSFV